MFDSNMLFTTLSTSLLFLLLHSVSTHSAYQTLNDDVLGLIVFKAALVDPDSILASWNEEDDTPCFWFGVKCDPFSRRVTGISLDNSSLSGHVGRGLLRLQSLQSLSLSHNNLTGPVNPDLTRMLPGLRFVDFSHNGFSGLIPDEFFQQCGSLTYVSFAGNNLDGEIPASLSSCFGLTHVNFSSNRISGDFPAGVWNLRSLQALDLSDNLLEGEIPHGVSNLYDLRGIALKNNKLSGELPGDSGSCSFLEKVDFSGNFFSGGVPESLQRLNSCVELRLGGNLLTGFVPEWIGELKSIESLDLSGNRFAGRIPGSIGDMNKLKELNLSMNQLSGGLPDSISNCGNLLSLDVSGNRLSGDVPSWMFKASSSSPQGGLVLQRLDISSNVLSGEIPSDFSAILSILVLNMSGNQLFGSIPSSIRELKMAQVVDLSGNKLTGKIPSEIGEAVSLVDLRLHNNFLTGNIPDQIEKCSSLTSMMLSKNNLTGQIPAAIANLTNLQFVDLSFNNFSGSLPKELTNLSRLASFNVSHNRLEGELPVGGFFNIISPSSISDNPSLCGAAVNRSCPSVHPKPIVLNPNSSNSAHGAPSSNNSHRKIALSISALVAIGAAVFIVIGVIAVTLLNIHVRSSMSRIPAEMGTLSGGGDDYSCSPDPNYGKLVMFSGDAEFVAGTRALLNKDCEIGRGGFGVVYKKSLRDGRSVAIKKLTVSSLIKSQVEFETEVMKLGKARHYNLVALEGYYWTPSLQLLIYEYVSNSSLYKHLHNIGGGGGGSSRCLTWRERFNIVVGMAKGLAHLHQMNMIHYNLKSTNVLVDECGEAKVGDYGLARLLPTLDRCILSSKMQSALGYMAPEFACKTVKITEKCDVYGFGVLVLEVVTGRRPVEYMEDDVVVLSDMVRGALEGGKVEEIVDTKLRGNFPVDEAIPLVKLGLICASQVPSNRPDMEEVLNILEMIQCPADGQEGSST